MLIKVHPLWCWLSTYAILSRAEEGSPVSIKKHHLIEIWVFCLFHSAVFAQMNDKLCKIIMVSYCVHNSFIMICCCQVALALCYQNICDSAVLWILTLSPVVKRKGKQKCLFVCWFIATISHESNNPIQDGCHRPVIMKTPKNGYT